LEDLLRVFGGHALARYELGKVYEAQGQRDRAAEEYEKFLEAWSDADPELPALDDAQARLDRLAGL
jgi:hypothetical protein